MHYRKIRNIGKKAQTWCSCPKMSMCLMPLRCTFFIIRVRLVLMETPSHAPELIQMIHTEGGHRWWNLPTRAPGWEAGMKRVARVTRGSSSSGTPAWEAKPSLNRPARGKGVPGGKARSPAPGLLGEAPRRCI